MSRVEVIGEATLYLGDCLEILPTLPKVDAVITDPPYAIPAMHYVAKRGEETPKKSIGDLSIVEHWFRGVAEHFPETAAVYVFCDGQSYPIFFRAMYSKWKRVRPLVWDKLTSYNGYTWRHQHELIAWGESSECERVPTGDGDILKIRAVPVDEREHPAEKPPELIQLLVQKTEGTVLDPFMGSASTGVACIREGRKFIGCEIEPRYFDIACKRIDQAYKQRPLFAEEPQLKPEQLGLEAL